MIVAKIGTFEGMSRGGAPEGLLSALRHHRERRPRLHRQRIEPGPRPTPDLVPEETWDELRLFTISEIRSWILQFRSN